MVKIKVFGDSHTYGDGISDVHLEKAWAPPSKLTWPYYMFDSNEINNFAYSGSSNDTISLKLIRHSSKNDTVVIMFTYPERLHIVKNGYNFVASHNFCSSISDNGDENWIAQQLANKFETENKEFVTKNFDDNFIEIIYLKNILLCQSFCKSNNIKYYFTLVNAREKTKVKGSLKKYRDSLYDSIDWNNIFLVEEKYGFEDYAKKIKAKKGLDNNHWDISYHKLFGTLFLDWITKKENV